MGPLQHEHSEAELNLAILVREWIREDPLLCRHFDVANLSFPNPAFTVPSVNHLCYIISRCHPGGIELIAYVTEYRVVAPSLSRKPHERKLMSLNNGMTYPIQAGDPKFFQKLRPRIINYHDRILAKHICQIK
jgi:hypothetical protein